MNVSVSVSCVCVLAHEFVLVFASGAQVCVENVVWRVPSRWSSGSSGGSAAGSWTAEKIGSCAELVARVTDRLSRAVRIVRACVLAHVDTGSAGVVVAWALRRLGL